MGEQLWKCDHKNNFYFYLFKKQTNHNCALKNQVFSFSMFFSKKRSCRTLRKAIIKSNLWVPLAANAATTHIITRFRALATALPLLLLVKLCVCAKGGKAGWGSSMCLSVYWAFFHIASLCIGILLSKLIPWRKSLWWSNFGVGVKLLCCSQFSNQCGNWENRWMEQYSKTIVH